MPAIRQRPLKQWFLAQGSDTPTTNRTKLMELDLSILETGTPEEIEAALEAMDDYEIVDEQAQSPEPGATIDNSTSSTTDGETDNSASQADSNDEAVPNGVASKNGDHIIPYQVLEAERQAAKQLKEQLEQQQQELEAARTAQQQLEIRNRQLEELGVEPRDIPKQLDITPEQLAELQEDYPEVGGVIAAMHKQMAQLQQQVATQPAYDPVGDALKANPDLVNWQNNDPNRWTYAQRLDDELRNDPVFADMPLTQRFAEVARRTNAAFSGQAAADKADKANELPASPSDVGVSNTHAPSKFDVMANQDFSSLCDSMANMSEADIDALLFNAGL